MSPRFVALVGIGFLSLILIGLLPWVAVVFGLALGVVAALAAVGSLRHSLSTWILDVPGDQRGRRYALFGADVFAALLVVALSGSLIATKMELAQQERDRLAAEQAAAEQRAARVVALQEEWPPALDWLHEQALAVTEALDQGDGEAARAALDPALARIQPFAALTPGPEVETMGSHLADLEGRVAALEQSIRDEEERQAAVIRGLTRAKEVVADESLCNTPVEIAAAWTDLQRTQPDDETWWDARRVTTKLERCRRQCERDLDKALRDLMVMQRERLREQLELSMLEEGLDMRVTLHGTHKQRLKMTWVLMSRVTSHQLTDGGSMREGAFLSNLQDVGFQRVTFSDGYSESWYFDLEPQPEDDGGFRTLEPLGLGAPLALPSR